LVHCEHNHYHCGGDGYQRKRQREKAQAAQHILTPARRALNDGPKACETEVVAGSRSRGNKTGRRPRVVGQELVEQFVGLSGRRMTALLADRSAPKSDAPQF
jgi:hypothetical protein